MRVLSKFVAAQGRGGIKRLAGRPAQAEQARDKRKGHSVASNSEVRVTAVPHRSTFGGGERSEPYICTRTPDGRMASTADQLQLSLLALPLSILHSHHGRCAAPAPVVE